MRDERPTVFIIDDDVSVRDAIAGVVTSVGMRAVAFESARELLLAPAAAGPSCLVLDVRLQGASGLDFQRELARANNDIPIVFITGHGDVPMTVRAMKDGAIEFLTKPFRDQDLLDAMRIRRSSETARCWNGSAPCWIGYGSATRPLRGGNARS